MSLISHFSSQVWFRNSKREANTAFVDEFHPQLTQNPKIYVPLASNDRMWSSVIGCFFLKCILGVVVPSKFLCPQASCTFLTKNQIFSDTAVHVLYWWSRRASGPSETWRASRLVQSQLSFKSFHTSFWKCLQTQTQQVVDVSLLSLLHLSGDQVSDLRVHVWPPWSLWREGHIKE